MSKKKDDGLREFGLELIGDVPWGTHLCQFYHTKQDLIDILVPYFKAGLENNEFCMWVTAEPLESENARVAMEKAMPNFSKYLKHEQIEIISYKDWYVKGGAFDCDRVLQGWTSKLEKALKNGYAGLRLTGNTFWLEKKDWNAFTDYEEAVNNVIGKYNMIAVCTYSLDKCNANEIIDVIRNHQFALVKRSGAWALIESSERKKIAEDLLKTEQKYTALFNSMTEGAALHDVVYDGSGNAVDYVITDVNPAFEKITGLPKKQVVGKKASEAYGTGQPPYLDVYAKVASSGKPAWFETYFPPMQKHLSISVFSPSKGKFTTVFYDITDRKEREQELRDTLEASHRRQAEVSALLGASKAVLQHREFAKSSRLIFDSCKELLGATAGYVALLSKDGKENEVLFLNSGGLPCTVNPSLPMPIRGLRAEAYAKGKVVYDNDFSKSEWAKLMPTGHVMLANVLFAPLIVENKTVGIMGLANKPGGFTERDAEMALVFGEISSVALINSQVLEKLEENEKLLKAHSENLEEMVEEKTKQLRDAERLATIGATAGMVGHDIRNPLQAIIGDLYLAKDDLTSLPESEAKTNLKDSIFTIEEQLGYINKIVTDLQDYAKPLKPCDEEVDLEDIIKDTFSIVTIPENIQVTSPIEKGLRFTADSAFIKRVMQNLISNAVQAMPKGGKLTIKTYHDEDSAIITVEDTGIGIPEQTKTKLFQPLFTTKSKGQGFGLAVCKRLVEAMNGTITFDSAEGKGTRFTVRLPIKESKK